MRIQPPYALPDGAESSYALPERQFLFQGNKGWEPFSEVLQKEFALAASCRPAPGVVNFTFGGRLYKLLGLDGSCELQQENVSTGVRRRVRHAAPAASGAGKGTCRGGSLRNLCSVIGRHDGILARATFSLDMRAVPHHWWRRESLRSNCFASAAVAAALVADPALATVDCPAMCAPAMVRLEESMPPADESALRRALLATAAEGPAARPSTLALPSGRVVEGLASLEVQLAGCHVHTGSLFSRRRCKASWAPLRMRLPEANPGRMMLPDELEAEDVDFEIATCGRWLDAADLEQLVARDPSAAQCSICLSLIDVAVDGIELRCGHLYHGACLAHWFQNKKRCPQCQRDYGKVIGDQPSCGVMTWSIEDECLPGHQDSETTGMLVVYFHFPAGVDAVGCEYAKRSSRAYLPLNVQGLLLLELFKVAFRRRVMYGLGNSLTSGDYRPTFNIHLKTSRRGGKEAHGYPDADYFFRALDELRANGVTLADVF